MKFVAVLALTSGALAVPAITKRATAEETTDQYLFSISLPDFETKRAAQDPATLNWDSDGCTDAPDNPFGFDFLPACHRHDFGYGNYENQNRFTEDNRLKIDNNFKSDLTYQCQSASPKPACEALVDVYYAAVRTFGGIVGGPGRRDENEYEDKVANYHALLDSYRERGELPAKN